MKTTKTTARKAPVASNVLRFPVKKAEWLGKGMSSAEYKLACEARGIDTSKWDAIYRSAVTVTDP